MKDLLKIYGKYIGVTWFIMAFLLIVNLGGFLVFAIPHVTGGVIMFPKGLWGLDKIVDSEDAEDPFAMTKEIEEYLREGGFIFLLVLNDEGDVVYSWNKPAELKGHYTLGEVAGFTRWYLEDYPVKALRTQKGLLVAGRPKNSVCKYSMEISMDFMNDAMVYLWVLVGINLLTVLLVVIFLGYRYYKSLKPLSEGIGALSENRGIHLKEKGTASSLAAQLNRTSDILETQRKSLEKRDMARTEWIAGVSHDIRTPLSMIMGYADELGQSGNLSRGEREKAAVIRNQSLIIRQLIEDLNLTSRLEYHMQPLRFRPFRPASLLRRLAAETMNSEPGEQYDLIPDIEPRLEGFSLMGDEKLILRAVRNLLNNSIRHNPAGCRIYLSARQTDGGLLICVRDDGCGISDEVVRCLTEEKDNDGKERLCRGMSGEAENAPGETVREKKQPHIMGLRIVKQIVLAHKGVFTIQEKGHAVGLWFPAHGV